MSCVELVSFLRESISKQTNYIGENMFRFRALDDSQWRLRLQSAKSNGKMDLKLYGPDKVILHSVDRIREYFTRLEERHEAMRGTAERESQHSVDISEDDDSNDDTVSAVLRIQIAIRMYLHAKYAESIQALQKQQEIMLNHIQSEQAKLDELKASLDEALRARTATLESWQKQIHKKKKFAPSRCDCGTKAHG